MSQTVIQLAETIAGLHHVVQQLQSALGELQRENESLRGELQAAQVQAGVDPTAQSNQARKERGRNGAD